MDVFFILSVCFPSVPDLAAASSFFFVLILELEENFSVRFCRSQRTHLLMWLFQ